MTSGRQRTPSARRISVPVLHAFACASALLFSWLTSCAPTGFQDEAQLQGGVRILASSADHPFANPGEAVRVSVLAYDGRSAADRSTSAMRIYWFPFVCENPALDAYYACFPQFANPDGGTHGEVVSNESAIAIGSEDAGDMDASSDGGISNESGSQTEGSDAESGDASVSVDGGAPAASAEAGADAASMSASPVVSTFSFVVPANSVSSHPVTMGVVPYGLLVAFNVACAGQLTLLPLTGNPQAPPLGCTDSSGNVLGPDSYVFGYTRVYAYLPDAGAAGINTNPVIDCIDVEGAEEGDGGAAGACAGMVPLNGSMPTVSASTVRIAGCDSPQASCSSIKIGAHVTPSSWEAVGGGLHEEIWADYYSTFGSFTHDATLLYDPSAGLIGPPSKTDTQFNPPLSPGGQEGYIWIVVHDNRGGASWVSVPVHIGS